MASSKESSSMLDKIPINSQDTALCIIPPNVMSGDIERLRELYDKAYGKWPAHINLIYPFVTPENLSRAQAQIKAHFESKIDSNEPQMVALSETGMFKHRSNSTVFLQESRTQSTGCMALLRSMALEALGQKPTPSNLHLTIGQSEDNTLFSQQFLLGKAQLLPVLEFPIGALAVLVRERVPRSDAVQRMKLWGTIDITYSESVWRPSTPEYWIRPPRLEVQKRDQSEPRHANVTGLSRDMQSGPTYHYDAHERRWVMCKGTEQEDTNPTAVTVSSYNVLIDSEYPPTRDRDSFLVRTIMSSAAAADILVLQEISDDFLSHILCNPEIQEQYPYTSHGPPSQPDIGPLSSLRNIIILSRWHFSWTFLPFHQRHKGALVANFGNIAHSKSLEPRDLVVAGVHLSAGLTDSTVSAKKLQLQTLTAYLEQTHGADSWIVAGDLNLVTSTYTINTALKEKLISEDTVTALSQIETAFNDAGLVDTWTAAHLEATDDIVPHTYDELYEGEEGATFDPRNNILAAISSETSSGRPQRYDRVLVRSQDTLRTVRCNQFGLPENVDGAYVVASDHSGIRSTLEVLKTSTTNSTEQHGREQRTAFECKRACRALSNLPDLSSVLTARGMFPTEEEEHQRATALSLLRRIVLGSSDDDNSAMSDIPMVIVPVGSYALGVWTTESDIDCLCIGTISSKTFFKLARQRLAKAQDQGVRVLRKVEANTGTMLELSINGVAMDLQYCPAARVVER
jgi:hypothetical protein